MQEISDFVVDRNLLRDLAVWNPGSVGQPPNSITSIINNITHPSTKCNQTLELYVGVSAMVLLGYSGNGSELSQGQWDTIEQRANILINNLQRAGIENHLYLDLARYVVEKVQDIKKQAPQMREMPLEIPMRSVAVGQTLEPSVPVGLAISVLVGIIAVGYMYGVGNFVSEVFTKATTLLKTVALGY
ncbi:MAG: hypothetical protein ABIG95_03640 [Candidatus Woesearchaeota archaeon]